MADDAAKPEDNSASTTGGAEPETAGVAEEMAQVAPTRRPIPVERWVLVAGLIAVLVLGTLTGWVAFRAYEAHAAEVHRKLFLQVARQGAVNLTTVDYQHADADVQRILDSATGTFYDNFSQRSRPFVDIVKHAQSKSVGTVTEAGVESQRGDEGQVLVAVTVKTSTPGSAEQELQAWRMRITVRRMGDGGKVSNVAFVS